MQELRNFSPLHTFWKKKKLWDVLVKKKNDIKKNKEKEAKKKMTMTANKKNLWKIIRWKLFSKLRKSTAQRITGNQKALKSKSSSWNIPIINKLDELFFVCIFRFSPWAYGSSYARGGIRAVAADLHTPQPQQRQIWATAYTTTHSNAGLLTHWARPGMEPSSSWILAGLITPEPRQQLLDDLWQDESMLKFCP